MKKYCTLLFALLIFYSVNAQVTNTESFDGTTFPPTGWTRVSPGSLTWNRATATVHPSGNATHSGAGLAYCNSWSVSSGTSQMITPVYDLSGRGSNTPTISLWVYRDAGYTGYTDKLDIYINTSASTSGATLLGTVYRHMNLTPSVVSAGWYQYSYNVPVAFNGTSNYAIIQATSNYGNDIHMDDVVWISYPPPCSGTPAPGNTVSSLNPVCSSSNFTVSLQNTISGTGITYQWQSSPTGVTYTNIVGATASTYAATQVSSTYYRCFVTCTATSNTALSTPLQVTNSFLACYCQPQCTSGCGSSDVINNVTISTLNNTTGCTATPSYINYGGVATTPTLNLGTTYPISVTVGPGGTEYVAAWIDYNQNGTFDASEYINIGTGNGSIVSNSITPPLTATQGVTKMRIRVRWGTPIANTDACSTFSFGETEDYNVNLVCPTPTVTTNPTAQAVCIGGSASFTAAASGASISYQWQESTNGGSTWANLANSATYSNVTTGTLGIASIPFSMNAYQYRCVGSTPCSTLAAITTAATLTVNTAPSVTTNPVSTATICENTGTTFTVAASGAGVAYQWQLSTNGGTVWNNLTNTAPYSTVGTSVLTITSAPASISGYKYRAFVTGTCSPTATSNTATITVNPVPVITTHPSSISLCPGGSNTFTAAASGFGVTYQWQLSTNSGASWATLANGGLYSNVGTQNLTVTGVTSGMSGYQYRCVATGGCSPAAISNAAVLTVNTTITITSQPPVSQFACIGSTASINLGVTGATTFQWYGDFGSGFVPIVNNATYSGATTASLLISNVPPSANGTYRCIVGSSCTPPFASNTSVLNVYLVTTVTTQPSSVTNCSGVNSYFTVNANGSNLTYQWQLSTNGGTTWGNLSNSATYGGVTANQLTIFNTPASLNTYQYRCVVTGSCASIATSNAAILTVNTPPVVTANPVNVTTCLGTNASYSVAATGSSISYKWQVYNNITWTNVVDNAIYSNSATATLNLTGVTATMNGYAYRCVVTGICPNNPAISNQASLTVNMPPAITANPIDKIICLGTNTSYSVSATGTAPITYQWQADQGSGFVNISNGINYIGVTTNTLNVNFAPLTFNGYKYRCAVNGLCAPPANSGFGTITINDTATVVSVPFTDTLCEGDSSLFAVNLGGPVTSLQWQESDGLGGFNDLPAGTPPYIGVNGPVLRINPANVSLYGKQYRCKVSSSCNVVYSNVFTLITYKVPNFILDPIDATVPQEKDATFIVDGSDTGYIYYWQASSDDGNNFSNIYNNNMYSGVQTKTLTVIKVNPAENGWLFRCIVKDNKGYCYKDYDTSYAAKLTVGPLTPFPVNVVTTTAGSVKFSVYPNPVHGSELMVKTDNSTVKTVHYRIIDQFGRTMQDEHVILSQANNAPISVANLVSGVYTIQFYDEKHAINQSIRFTKQQ